jgi:hypothetical protein
MHIPFHNINLLRSTWAVTVADDGEMMGSEIDIDELEVSVGGHRDGGCVRMRRGRKMWRLTVGFVAVVVGLGGSGTKFQFRVFMGQCLTTCLLYIMMINSSYIRPFMYKYMTNI